MGECITKSDVIIVFRKFNSYENDTNIINEALLQKYGKLKRGLRLCKGMGECITKSDVIIVFRKFNS